MEDKKAFLKKIKNLDELANIISDFKKEGHTVVMCHGDFDLVHLGHIRHLEAAKREGDILVVTLTPDKYISKGPGHPVFSEHLRAEFIAALQMVDYVTINEWPTSTKTLKKLKPDVYCKGNDYADAKEDLTGKIKDEEAAVKSVGGRIYFTDEITFSSSSLLNRHFEVYPKETQDFLKIFRSKHPSKNIIEQINSLKNLKVLVIGEAIIDEYHYCTPLGKSPKENMIPAKYINEEHFAGGVLAIANHIAGFCEHIDVVTSLGTINTREEFVREHLKPNVNPKFFYRPDSPTIVKRRFVEVELFRKLFEVQFMDGSVMPNVMIEEICGYLNSVIADYDLVVVGDYGHGFLCKDIINLLCEKARFLTVNTQTNSANIGFNPITKYPRADFICIDEPEIRLATHDDTSSINVLVNKIINQLNCNTAVVTQGHRGSTIYRSGENLLEIPVFSRDVVDRVGAGDAYLSISALCCAAGFPAELIGFIGNAAGALAIHIVGNKKSVEPVALHKYIRTLLK